MSTTSLLQKRSEKRPLRNKVGKEESVQGSVRGSFSSFTSIPVKPIKTSVSGNADVDEVESTEEREIEATAKEKVHLTAQTAVSIGCVSQEGLYHDNEDRMVYGIDLSTQIDGYVGVFDGHGGEDCADYVSRQLEQYLNKFFCQTGDFAAGEGVMKRMFHIIEADYTKIATEEDDTSGSCATVVVVKGFEAIVANIGDCKAIAVTNIDDPESRFQVLTGDHRADHPDESARINKAGGSVVDGRVCNLQPSRSFGDLDVKEIVGEGVVIPTPEVSRVTMQNGGFMIVATDGLWDSVDEVTCVEVAKKVLLKTDYDAEAAAEVLVDLAVDAKASDDITVSVIVWLE